MQGLKRRILYVGLYEFIAIIVSAIILSLIAAKGPSDSVGIAVVASGTAILWNLVFNYLFERWEAGRQQQGRSIAVRLLHALGFEGGLVIFLVPMIAWWFDISLWQALLMELGLLVFFLVYTFVFNWVFDRVFGLPLSARTTGGTSGNSDGHV